MSSSLLGSFFFFQAEDGIRDGRVTGVQTCALPICKDLLRRHSLASGPGGCKSCRVESGTQIGQIMLIGISFDRSELSVEGKMLCGCGEQAGGMLQVSRGEGLLCQAQQALPGDCAGIDDCCQGQAFAV